MANSTNFNNLFYQEIITFHENHLTNMISKYSKVLQIRLDIHYPQNGIKYNSKCIRDFTENFTRDLKRNYPLVLLGQKRSIGHKAIRRHNVDPRLIWVSEKSGSCNNHYHFIILVNGHAMWKVYGILKRAERQWANALKLNSVAGLIHRTKKNFVLIKKHSAQFTEQMNKAHQQSLYLAKKTTKLNEKHARKFSGTRLLKI